MIAGRRLLLGAATTVGWADVYDNKTEGQEMDVTQIADGAYTLRTVINPDRFLAEADYENNSAVARLELSGGGSEVRLLG